MHAVFLLKAKNKQPTVNNGKVVLDQPLKSPLLGHGTRASCQHGLGKTTCSNECTVDVFFLIYLPEGTKGCTCCFSIFIGNWWKGKKVVMK